MTKVLFRDYQPYTDVSLLDNRVFCCPCENITPSFDLKGYVMTKKILITIQSLEEQQTPFQRRGVCCFSKDMIRLTEERNLLWEIHHGTMVVY